MAQTKTKPETLNAFDFIANIDDEKKRLEALEIVEILKNITNHPPIMWGPSIIGFDKYEYIYESGHGGTMCKIGYSPRKSSHVFYVLIEGYDFSQLLEKIGKHTTGKVCLYVKKLSDIDMNILREIITIAYQKMNEKYG